MFEGEVARTAGMSPRAKPKLKDSPPRRRAEARRDCEVRVLEMVATGSPLHQTLAEVVPLFEVHAKGRTEPPVR